MARSPAPTMTPDHPGWPEFCGRLAQELERFPCQSEGPFEHANARRVLHEMGCNVPASLEYFRDHHGFCDCEVLMNVEPLDMEADDDAPDERAQAALRQIRRAFPNGDEPPGMVERAVALFKPRSAN